ncbi:U3 small nucleolar RNA-associated protein 20 [[Candida] anglica]|uniref:U3 small nucleolar RNA-associated protein 20 n=1 Tax=[Candida] anglica TaxID=148631 RepID=A0ABP0EKX6_9ASCO
MGKAPPGKKTTQSARRHAFQSFRERVDSIKIDPHLSLSKRAHDDAETSHFLSTLEHWKEINVSGNFTEFLDKVEIHSQTLPQILYHQNTIYDALYTHIQLNDVYSIQPLLELLSQFIHDLGPDFIEPFYIRTLELLMEVATATNPNDSQNNRNSSNVLEWSFNCMAFTFKYLSKSLANDLLPTFKVLSPLLKLTTKKYISRYCAEALSFLVRKSKENSLDAIIAFSFNSEESSVKENDAYCQSLVVMYSEGMKSTRGAFHSKAPMVFSKLLENTLSRDPSSCAKHVSIVCDIILSILNHGSIEACDKFYKLATTHLSKLLSSDIIDEVSLICISQFLTTLAFAESGKKITSWTPLLSTLEGFLSLIITKKYSCTTLSDSVVYLVVIIFRNCSVQDLTRNHLKLLEAVASLDSGKYFYCFVDTSMDICGPTMTNFGLSKHVQEFVNTHSSSDSDIQRLSYFVLRSKHASDIRIPVQTQELVQKQLNYKSINSPEDLSEMYWRLLALRYSETTNQSEEMYKFLIGVLAQFSNSSFTFRCNFSEDIAATIVDLLLLQIKNNPAYTSEVLDIVVTNFSKFQESPTFLLAMENLVKDIDASKVHVLEENFDDILMQISNNLKLSNHEARYNSIKLAIKIHEVLKKEVPVVFSDIRIIEEIPLSLNTGRDLASRIRNMAIEFKKLIKATELETIFITRYMFGLLTNKFQPCWLAVFEALPLISHLCSKEIWNLSSYFMNLNFDTQEKNYGPPSLFSGFAEERENGFSPLITWLPHDTRITGSFHYVNKTYFEKYAVVTISLLAHAEAARGETTFSEIMRSQSLQALAAVPSIAEAHSDILVPLVLHKSDVEEEDDDEAESGSDVDVAAVWNLKDRNSLVGLFSKFKNLKKIYASEEFYQHMLKLLCNKQAPVQKMALEVILNWKIGTLNKYRDNLLNLLDNTIFRDEIAKFITKDTDSKIEDQDLSVLMPIVLRILFGRAQSSPKSNSQTGRKFAVITVLPNLSPDDITSFLNLGSERIGYHQLFSGEQPQFDSNVTITTMRRINGFVKLLSDVYGVLGSKYSEVLSTTIEPLVYSLIIAQRQIDAESIAEEDQKIEKSARNVRQVGMRSLSELFTLLGEQFQWDKYINVIHSYIVKPRLAKFAPENLQQTSSLMKVMTGWIAFPNLVKFLYVDNYSAVESILSLLENENSKDVVLLTVLEFAYSALQKQAIDDEYYSLLAHIVTVLLKTLPAIIDRSANRDVNTKAVDILLLLLEQDYVDDNSTRGALIESLAKALDKPHAQVDIRNKVNILKSLSSLIDNYDCSFADVDALYQTCSKSFRLFSERKVRDTLVTVFRSFGNRFEHLDIVADILQGLNAFSNKRMEEPDFEKRLDSFKKINDEMYSKFTTTQWLPILNCALYFINDELELAIRTNATYTLNRFVDSFSEMDSFDVAKEHIHMFKDTVLPNIRTGLRKSTEVIQTEYISVLAHVVQHSKYFDELDDMKVLLFHNDEEANFFHNVNHIQLHRRQRAIKRLREYRNQLSDGSISHYILPIIEHYALCTDEKLRNIANETVDTISFLARCISWNQFKALFRRYVSNLKKSKPESLRDHVALIVALSRSLMDSNGASESSDVDDMETDTTLDVMKNRPTNVAEFDSYVTQELFPQIAKVLAIRDDETIVSRIRLSEALTNLVTCISDDLVESQLPGILTSTCQVIRSRSEELRDAVRKSLGRIATTLGAKYFKFILQELKTSLSRGSQIHVLSFTVHTLLVTMQESLSHSDLDESAEMVVNVIMEDIFGAAGQEKDAEGYTSKMKEVKFNKSFDSGELLSANISLKSFRTLVSPVKMLLQENVSLKVQNKLDELLRRYALGLNHNNEASSHAILQLCYELHEQSTGLLDKRDGYRDNKSKKNDTSGHFLVKLNAKPQKTQVEYASYITTLQKFSFDLLRTAITRHESLLTVTNLEGFIPLLESGLQSNNEGVIISCLRVLNLVIKLPFSQEIDNTFKSCSRRALNIVKDCPSTNSELCQACLKFLATVIRHKSDIKLKETAISYLLVRIQPDLEEPNRQGLAFAFLKAVLSQHVLIPEVYDTMDKVSKIMIVNHAKEIRDMSRSAYFQFLMEYDQGRGRLEKQFKFLLNNLSYATQDGRSSVMELLHLIIFKSGSELLGKLASSFFIGLANVVVSDDSSKCREMAAALLGSMFKKLGHENLTQIEKYCSVWLSQDDNRLLQRCGLQVYKLYAAEFGFGKSTTMDKLALARIQEILIASKSDSENNTDVEWELVYSTLSVLSTLASTLKDSIFGSAYASIWAAVLESLLYPHSWVRLIASRLVGMLLSNLDSIEFTLTAYEIQTVAYRLLHQLGAPSISEALGGQIVKNLVIIAMRWEKNQTIYEFKSESQDEEESVKYKFAMDYLVARVSAIMRQENNYRDSFVSKKSSIQLAAMLVQIIPEEKLPVAAERFMLGMYNFNDLNPNNSEAEAELVNLSTECNSMIENKLGVTEYTKIYTLVKQTVDKRRQDRRTKRAQLNITAPDVAAKRKMRKHERFREKRKHEKDDNGYYKTKRNKFS